MLEAPLVVRVDQHRGSFRACAPGFQIRVRVQRVQQVQIQVEAIDRSRLLSDVTRVLSDHHVNILSATVATGRDRVAISRFVFEMAETTHLNTVLAAVRKVDGVYDVYRITGSRHAEVGHDEPSGRESG